MEKEISIVYEKFFEKLNVNRETGIIENSTKRFATYPYIGSKYGDGKDKILIVGLDIGNDETSTENIIQTFKQRRDSVMSSNNPHIAGTYTTATYFLKKHSEEFSQIWDELSKFPSSQRARKNNSFFEKRDNPLEYIALTNYYKFVEIKRINRAGDLDRKSISKSTEQLELDLFINEVKILNPNIIVFQSKNTSNNLIQKVRENFTGDIFVAPHPSYREKGGRNSNIYCSKFELK